MIRSISLKAYQVLRSSALTVNPLPSLSTLKRRISHFLCPPGIQQTLFSLLCVKFKNEDSNFREAALMFDEMQLNEVCEFSERLKKLFIQHKKVQVVQVRGIIHPWKQIVYYDFDTNMDMKLLNTLIIQCEQSNVKVRAIVCDMGNAQLLSHLKVYKSHNNFFPNPFVEKRKLYIICDTPHCFKNMRNHTLDYGMIVKLENENIVINKNMFYKLLEDDQGDLKYCYKLTLSHIDVEGHDRQRVRTAVQLFSDTVSKALQHIYGDVYKKESNIISIIDKFWDVMDSRSKYHWKKYKCGLGMNESMQLEILDKMENIVRNMFFLTKTGKLGQKQFQSGIIVTIKSVRQLYRDLKSEGKHFLLTSRVNQDCLENTFSTVRYMGGNNGHPTAKMFCDRIRMLLVSKNVNFVINNPSVEYEESTQFISADILDELSSSNFDEPSALENSSSENENIADCPDEFFQCENEMKAKEMRSYVGGFICRKLNIKPAKQVPKSWIHLKGEGRLIQPSEAVQDILEKCDKVFNDFNGISISLRKCHDPLGKVMGLMMKKFKDINPKIIKLYCKVKFYGRLRLLNQKLKESKGRRVRYLKQTAQFIN